MKMSIVTLLLFSFFISICFANVFNEGHKANIVCQTNSTIETCKFRWKLFYVLKTKKSKSNYKNCRAPNGKKIRVDESLSGKYKCNCKNRRNRCGIIIHDLSLQDQGVWTCIIKARGQKKKIRKSINIRVKSASDDVDSYEYFSDEIVDINTGR